MNKEQKAAVVEEIASQIQAADAVFAVDYRGISVPQAAELRARLREADATFRVVKNSLTERAVEKAGADGLGDHLEGPTALTFVHGDAAVAAKALADVQRSAEVLDFKGGVLAGRAIGADDITAIARLPSRETLHAQLVGLASSPLTGLVRGLGGMLGGLAAQLGQIRDQGLIGGEAPAGDSGEPAAEAPASEAKAGEEPAAGEAAPEPPVAAEDPGREKQDSENDDESAGTEGAGD